MPLVENFCDSVPLKEGVPVGVHRSQPVGHGVEWSVPICRCEKKIFSAIKKQKRLYDSYSKDWLDLLNTAWIVKIQKAYDD